MHWRRKWQPTPVFLPGDPRDEEPGGLPSMGSHRVEHDWSNLASAAVRGVLSKRTGGCSEPLGDFHCDLGHLDSVLLLSYLESVHSKWEKTCFLDGTRNVVVTDRGHSGIHCLSNILWEQMSSKCTLAKVTKNLLIFFCFEYLHH